MKKTTAVAAPGRRSLLRVSKVLPPLDRDRLAHVSGGVDDTVVPLSEIEAELSSRGNNNPSNQGRG